MARNTPCKASSALWNVLKASSRKASQVVLFKGTKKIFSADVDNFVRKYPNVGVKYSECILRVQARQSVRKKIPFIFNELKKRSQREFVCARTMRPPRPWCA